jgi:hypothetical protein
LCEVGAHWVFVGVFTLGFNFLFRCHVNHSRTIGRRVQG